MECENQWKNMWKYANDENRPINYIEKIYIRRCCLIIFSRLMIDNDCVKKSFTDILFTSGNECLRNRLASRNSQNPTVDWIKTSPIRENLGARPTKWCRQSTHEVQIFPHVLPFTAHEWQPYELKLNNFLFKLIPHIIHFWQWFIFPLGPRSWILRVF